MVFWCPKLQLGKKSASSLWYYCLSRFISEEAIGYTHGKDGWKSVSILFLLICYFIVNLIYIVISLVLKWPPGNIDYQLIFVPFFHFWVFLSVSLTVPGLFILSGLWLVEFPQQDSAIILPILLAVNSPFENSGDANSGFDCLTY